MQSHRFSLAAVAVGALLPTLMIAPPALATPDETDVATEVVLDQSAAEVVQYWTPERLAAATAVAEPAAVSTQRTASAGESSAGESRGSTGVETSVPATPAAGETAEASSATAASTPPELTLYQRPYDSPAEKAAGKVVFSTPDGDSFCSAGSITAPNKSLAWTAAHCARNHDVANVAYVPAYNSANTGTGWTDGDAPYGVWPARKLVHSPDDDFTAVVVEQVGGRYLQDVVGANGVRFNADLVGKQLTVIGYPAARIYDGSDMTWCTNTVTSNTDGDIRIQCDTEGGSSGGPYVIENADAGSLGVQVASHSAGGGTEAGGSWFDDVARAVYDEASTS